MTQESERHGAKVGPLEGAPDIAVGAVVLMAGFVGALRASGLLSGILWALVAFVGLFLAMRLYVRLETSWGRLHFSLLYRYSGLLGRATALAEFTHEEIDHSRVLVALVKSAYPNLDDQEACVIVETAKQRLTTFADRPWLERRFRTPGLTEKLAAAMQDPKETGLFVRYVVAEIVRRKYGDPERQEYIYAVVTGLAR